MCNFNQLLVEEKRAAHVALMDVVVKLGGKAAFYHLLEMLRHTKPEPLLSSKCWAHYEEGKVSWDKIIFKDKIELFKKARILEHQQKNFLPSKAEKSYKKVLNVVKTLTPINIEIAAKGDFEFEGISLKIFDMIDAERVMINPLFDMIFFCSMDTVKKVVNYKIKEASASEASE